MDSAIAAIFARYADACRNLGSTFHGTLCDLFATRLMPESAFARRIDAWPAPRAFADALPLRAIGGLHALVRQGKVPALAALYPPHEASEDALWARVTDTIAAHDAFLAAFLDSPPQTNEVARSSVLLGCAQHLHARYGRALAWWEIGASAGLNLGFPDYRYQLGVGTWNEDIPTSVEIQSRWEGNCPPLDVMMHVSERAGCDIAPLDPRADRERLLSYVWPDQRERLTRTEAALNAVARADWRVERAPASEWVARQLARAPQPDVLRVIAHTIVWQYLPQEERARITDAMQRAEGPLVRVSYEGDGEPGSAAITLTHYPSGEVESLGRADFHGRWVRWS